MQKIKLSWSIMRVWSAGQHDEAIAIYRRVPRPSTKAMDMGRVLHDRIAIEKPQFFPWLDESYIWEDTDPIRQLGSTYFVVELFPWLDVSIIMDCYSPKDGIVIDWKTGVTPTTHNDPMQLYLYSLVMVERTPSCVLSEGYFVKVGADMAVKEYVRCEIPNSRRFEALEWTRTIGSEIYQEVCHG